jgi:homoserine kinase
VDVAAAGDTPWEPRLLAVDVKGGTVREYTEGSTI